MNDHYSVTDSNNNNKSVNYSSSPTVENSSRKISATSRRYIPWSEKIISEPKYSNEIIFEKPSSSTNINKSTNLNKINNLNKLNNNLYLTGIDESSEIISPIENQKISESSNIKARKCETVANRNRPTKKNKPVTFLPLIHRNSQQYMKNPNLFSCCDMELMPVYLNQMYNKQLIEGNSKKLQTLENADFDKICAAKKISRSTNKDGPKEYIMKTKEINRIKFCLNYRNQSIKEHENNLKKYLKGMEKTIQTIKNYIYNLENNFIKKINQQLRNLSKKSLDEKLKEEGQIRQLNKLRKEVNNLLYLIKKTDLNKQSIEKWLSFQILLKEGKRIDIDEVTDYIKENYKNGLIIDTVNEFDELFEEKQQKNLRLMKEMEMSDEELKAFHEEFSAVKKDLSSDTDLNMRVLEKQKLLNLIKARNEELIAQKKKYLKMMTEAKIKKTFSYSSRKKNKEINYDHIYDEINKIFKYIIDNDIESIGEHKTHIHNIQSAQSKSFKALMKMKIIEYSLNYLSIYFKKNDNAKNEEIIKLLEDYIEKEHKRRKAEKYKNERKQKEIELYKQLEEKKDRVIIKPSRKIDDLIFIKNEKKRKEAKIKAKNEKKKEIDIFDFLYDSDEEEEENK